MGDLQNSWQSSSDGGREITLKCHMTEDGQVDIEAANDPSTSQKFRSPEEASSYLQTQFAKAGEVQSSR